MNKHKKAYILFAVFFLINILTACGSEKSNYDRDNNKLFIHYLDVGQGDSMLIEQGSHAMLIDAGKPEYAEKVKQYIKNEKIENLDYVIGTHPHDDHIGGMKTIVRQFNINKIFMPKITATTDSFKDMIEAIRNKNKKINVPKSGENFYLGKASVTILAPNSSSYDDLNNYSIVIKMKFGNNSFLFEGDAEKLSENEILSSGEDISADVIKIGHHGSSSSTSKEYLERVNPKFAVISCGKNNDYGHPHKATVETLKNKNIELYRTDECGDVVCISDGNKIKFNVKPGDYRYGKEKK